MAHSMNHLTPYEEANVLPAVAAFPPYEYSSDPTHDTSPLWSPATMGRGFSERNQTNVHQHLEHFYYQQQQQQHHCHQHLPPPQDQRFPITSNHFLRTRSPHFRFSPPHLQQQLTPPTHSHTYPYCLTSKSTGLGLFTRFHSSTTSSAQNGVGNGDQCARAAFRGNWLSSGHPSGCCWNVLYLTVTMLHINYLIYGLNSTLKCSINNYLILHRKRSSACNHLNWCTFGYTPM